SDRNGRLHPGINGRLQIGIRCRLAPEYAARGLRRDRAAIEAALSTPWSTGAVEGKITKIKLIKRSMYGRANIALLRHRVLAA
ncbi:transposase, partial [Roseomonas mucosa]|uniref:transposase n=1 Tax=Roseomonas mucosa TaxID=207340 RepID=UPI0028CF48AD